MTALFGAPLMAVVAAVVATAIGGVVRAEGTRES
jgi:hypothetical protein